MSYLEGKNIPSDYRWNNIIDCYYTPFQDIKSRRLSIYEGCIKDRVYHHNMTYGLCEGNYRNAYWKIYYTRKKNKR